ncbi:AzlC family ABC transporter permease [Amphibacillus sp. MSJ-3]|uniref:AzlC family ABC transporter permease n=1 Tax=Amphibacillus sp. MSJ-3 TaxID=2841505 RepID=UPI001C0F3838|nr:AzlC family ABC transporter permease [Amphibacillus sp. MSJ-3]MBU5595363.1 AzlC family ABC transporter permease [Amphibacillus sp. MSJ-3]
MAEVSQLKRGIKAGIPIMLGYFPIAITYGVLASQAGLSILELTSMSALVYGGASQFMATNMLLLHMGALEIIIATFVLNFRHFVMGLSFMHRLQHVPLKWRVGLSMLITDETFSVTTVEKEVAKEPSGHLFYFGLFVSSYSSWLIGSFIGGFVGDIIPEAISQSFGIALYAMFIALLVPSVKTNYRYGMIAGLAMILNYSLSFIFQEGWSIVLATILASFFGLFFMRRRT